jgi:predicted dehydrogenase
MHMRRLRVGIIGLGVGEQHIQAYLNTGECEVVLCDLSTDRLARAQRRYPGARICRDANELFADRDVDVVSIASYDDAHADQVIKALDAGKHVFVEKPLCQTREELQDIKRAWLRHEGKLKLDSNLVLRAAPAYVWLKEKLADGFLGQPFAFDGDYLYGRLHKITQGWRKDVENYSVMEGGGVHLLDLFVWVTGQRPSVVTAVGNRICTRGTAFRYDDYVAVTLQCPSGLVARVSANFGCVHRHQHVIRLFGTEGTFLHDDAGPRFYRTREPGVGATPLLLPTLPASKGDLIGSFVEAILKDQDLSAQTQSHFDVLSVCLACDEALRTRSAQEVCFI